MEWLYVLIALVVLIVLYVISVYNKLIKLRVKVDNQWAQIDVQLKRRADLIPNLVETVKGYAKHEKETLEEVINARNSYLSADTPDEQIKSSGELTGVISKLFALSESYPELKADKSFVQMQKDLNDTEDKIAYSRQFYNDIVMKFNASIATFPTNVIAGMFNFKERDFFEALDSEKANVKVKF